MLRSAVFISLLIPALFPIHANAQPAGVRTVNVVCPANSLQAAVNNAKGPATIAFKGTCEEDVVVRKDDITLDGQRSGELETAGVISGSLTFDGAQRGVIRLAKITGPGNGIIATNGASVLIHDNTITENGSFDDVYSGGVLVEKGSSAEIRDNHVTNNTSSGVGVFNGGFAQITRNFIAGNGRTHAFESGIDVARAMVRGESNEIVDNGYAALSVSNDGSYRTGAFLFAEQPDDPGCCELLSIGDREGQIAVDASNMAYVDLRQVHIVGDVFVGRQSMLQVRGDQIDAENCSTFDGNLDVSGFNSGAVLRAVERIAGGDSGGGIIEVIAPCDPV